MAEPVTELVTRADPAGEPAAFACGVCGNLAHARSTAAACCVCHTCGVARREPGRAFCAACAARHLENGRATGAERDRQETARLATAARVTPEAAHAGWLYWRADKGPNEGFFADASELRAWCYDAGEEPPPRVWACAKRCLGLDPDDILRAACETLELHEDADENLPDALFDELVALCNAWSEKAGAEVFSWFALDGATDGEAVALDPARWAAFKAEQPEDGP